MSRTPWGFGDLDGYIREGEPGRAERAETDQVKALLSILGDEELSAMELMSMLGLSHRHTFRQNYLNPALKAGLIERTIPDRPTSRLRKCRKAGR